MVISSDEYDSEAKSQRLSKVIENECVKIGLCRKQINVN